MAIELAALISRLQRAIPARDDVPSDYEQLIKDAVFQLASDVPLVRTGTLSIVNGTASYTLPDDFLFMILLESANNADGIINSAAGIIPVSASWEETYDIGGGAITFYPTPSYTMNRDYRYAAGYALNNGAYDRMTENGARIALLYAQYLSLQAQATALAPAGWRYTIGDESVDKSNQAKSIQAQADMFLKQYQNAIKGLKGYGMAAKYNSLGY